MSIIRAVDTGGDWTFGKGRSNYLSANLSVAQNIKTRLAEWQGDCFFNLGAGLVWRTLLSSNSQTALALAIKSIILNTEDVIQIQQLGLFVDRTTRAFSIQYTVVTTYSTITDIFTPLTV